MHRHIQPHPIHNRSLDDRGWSEQHYGKENSSPLRREGEKSGIKLNLSGMWGQSKFLNLSGMWTYLIWTYLLFFYNEKEGFGPWHNERLRLASIWTYPTWIHHAWTVIIHLTHSHRHNCVVHSPASPQSYIPLTSMATIMFWKVELSSSDRTWRVVSSSSPPVFTPPITLTCTLTPEMREVLTINTVCVHTTNHPVCPWHLKWDRCWLLTPLVFTPPITLTSTLTPEMKKVLTINTVDVHTTNHPNMPLTPEMKEVLTFNTVGVSTTNHPAMHLDTWNQRGNDH